MDIQNPNSTPEQPGKKLPTLSIVNKKETKHRGFGQGSIDLSQLTSVIVDGDEAYIDLGALVFISDYTDTVFKIELGVRFGAM